MKIELRETKTSSDGKLDKSITSGVKCIYGYFVFTDWAVNSILEEIKAKCPNDDTVYDVLIDGCLVASPYVQNERLTIKNKNFNY